MDRFWGVVVFLLLAATAASYAPTAAASEAECAARLRVLGASDAARVGKVCSCLAGGRSTDECFAETYAWDHDVANAMAGDCIAQTGDIRACTCAIWGAVEAKPMAEWKSGTAAELQEFITERMSQCRILAGTRT